MAEKIRYITVRDGDEVVFSEEGKEHIELFTKLRVGGKTHWRFLSSTVHILTPSLYKELVEAAQRPPSLGRWFKWRFMR